MNTKIQNAFRPNYASPPGETLLETIAAHGMGRAELAERIGVPNKVLNKIITGKAAINTETSLQLERVLSVPASFWSNLERNYRDACIRLGKKTGGPHR
jgi:addiction module HigA family antidote